MTVYYTHFTDEEVEAQSDLVTRLRGGGRIKGPGGWFEESLGDRRDSKATSSSRSSIGKGYRESSLGTETGTDFLCPGERNIQLVHGDESEEVRREGRSQNSHK